MEKLRKGQVTIFGKTISVLAAVLALAALSGVGLALLTAYISITGSATVKQSVLLNAIESTWKYNIKDFEEFPQGTPGPILLPSFNAVGGDEQDIGIKLSNYAEVEAPVIIKKEITGPVHPDYVECVDDKVEVWTGYTPTKFETEGTGTSAWDASIVHSGPNAGKLYVSDGTQGMATVTIIIEGGISLEDILDLKFWEKITSYTNGWGVNVILGVDADGDGTYESDDLAWHIGATQHSPAVLGDDTFIEMDGIGPLGAPIDWTQRDAYNIAQWWTTNVGGDGLSSDCYETLPNIFSVGCTDKKANLEPTDKVMVIKLVIGGSGSWMGETAYVDDLTLNGYIWNIGEACYGSPVIVSCSSDVWTAQVILPPRPDVNNPNTPSETWYCIRNKWDLLAVPGSYGFQIDVLPPQQP